MSGLGRPGFVSQAEGGETKGRAQRGFCAPVSCERRSGDAASCVIS